MREAAAGVTHLAVGHVDVGFRFAGDGVDDVGGAEAEVNVGGVVLVEKRGFVRGDDGAEDADVIIFDEEMMMRLVRHGDGGGGLGA
jgi:hypothetical protein